MSDENSTTPIEFELTSTLSREEERKIKQRACSNAYHKANPEKVKSLCKAWEQENKEKRAAYKKAYNADPVNKARQLANNRAWREAHQEKVKQDAKARREANPEQHKERNKGYNQARRGQEYGLPRGVFAQMLLACNEQCPLCKTPFSKLWNECPCIDHCHRTGVVRGLLCRACNQGIGLLKDNPKLLRAAARYLERHAQNEEGATVIE